eukprot:115693-Heterocapsa_arctica.AAC.1
MTARDYHDDVMRTIIDSLRRLEASPERRGSSKDFQHVANTQPEAELAPARARWSNTPSESEANRPITCLVLPVLSGMTHSEPQATN